MFYFVLGDDGDVSGEELVFALPLDAALQENQVDA